MKLELQTRPMRSIPDIKEVGIMKLCNIRRQKRNFISKIALGRGIKYGNRDFLNKSKRNNLYNFFNSTITLIIKVYTAQRSVHINKKRIQKTNFINISLISLIFLYAHIRISMRTYTHNGVVVIG